MGDVLHHEPVEDVIDVLEMVVEGRSRHLRLGADVGDGDLLERGSLHEILQCLEDLILRRVAEQVMIA